VTTHDTAGLVRPDPLLVRAELPLRRAYHPAGFQLHLATNSQEVIDATDECWRAYKPEFACEPMEFRVVVSPEGELASQPSYRLTRNLMSIVSDAHNFASVDFDSQLASIYVSEKTAADHPVLRWFFVEAIAYVLMAQRYVAPLHAASIARNGIGILLCGAPGAGKSTLSFAAAGVGWAFLSDDCTWLLAGGSDVTAIGKPHQVRFRDDATGLFPRLAGYAVGERPNGKIGIEVPMFAFPELRIALRCRVGGMAWLDRLPGVRPAIERIGPAEALRQMLHSSTYGDKVDAMHERATRRLLDLPACRLRYESLDDGLRLLSEFGATIGAGSASAGIA
jgi:hypothetical protein